jgi:response regulator of citrate/malate metabolism
MKILYVEDNITDADLTRRQLLEDMPGCELVVVRLLSEAERELAPGNDYDLVLLDMHLPDGNGMDLLIRIRQENLDVAVIVLIIMLLKKTDILIHYPVPLKLPW